MSHDVGSACLGCLDKPLSNLLNARGALSDLKKRGAAAWHFKFDKAWTASILNDFKNGPFYIHFVSLFLMLSRENEGKVLCKSTWISIKHKDSFTAIISLCFFMNCEFLKS